MNWFCTHDWDLVDKTVKKSSLEIFMDTVGTKALNGKINADNVGCVIFYEKCLLCKETRTRKIRTP